MNIGGRIEQRLRELGWSRKDLLDRVPDLSAQALSNLILRDSKRSEWDKAIADALGKSVMWLVYGEETPPVNEPSAFYATKQIQHVVDLMNKLPPEQQSLLARLADQITEPATQETKQTNNGSKQ